jgi:nitrogen PTS system EIIA component
MHITLRQAAAYLDVPEATVRRWIANRGLPAHTINERLHCNAIELWQWAVEQGIPVSRELLDQARREPDEVPPLAALLAAGGIHHDVPGGSKAEVMRQMVARLPLPPDLDRDFLLTVLEAREAMGSTGIGDGIAIPHARNPILLHVTRPFVTLCLLRQPVAFDAIDGQPVHSLFTLVAASVPSHLRVLAKLAAALRDDEIRRLLRGAAPGTAILDRVAALDTAAAAGPRGAGPAR